MDLNTCLPSTTYTEVMNWIKSTASGTILPVKFIVIRYEVHYFPQWLALIHLSLLSWYFLWDSPNNNATLCPDFLKNQAINLTRFPHGYSSPQKNSKHKAFYLKAKLSLQLTSTQSHTRPEISLLFGARQGISMAEMIHVCGVALHFSSTAGQADLPVAGQQSAPSSPCRVIQPGSKSVPQRCLAACLGLWAGCELLVHLAAAAHVPARKCQENAPSLSVLFIIH